MSPRVREKGALSQTAGGPGPPMGSRTPTYYPDPSAGREQTPRLGGSGAATCPQVQVRARPRRFPGKTRPPTAFNAVDVSVLCHSKARGDLCQAVPLTAHYQGTKCRLWRRPRHARQTATPVRCDNSATEYHNAYAVDPTAYAASYTASTGASPMGQEKTPLGQRVYRVMKLIRQEILHHGSTISVYLV